MPQLAAPQRFRLDRCTSGVGLIFIGLFKKLCLADRLTPFLYPKFLEPGRLRRLRAAAQPLRHAGRPSTSTSAPTRTSRGAAGACSGWRSSRTSTSPSRRRTPASCGSAGTRASPSGCATTCSWPARQPGAVAAGARRAHRPVARAALEVRAVGDRQRPGPRSLRALAHPRAGARRSGPPPPPAHTGHPRLLGLHAAPHGALLLPRRLYGRRLLVRALHRGPGRRSGDAEPHRSRRLPGPLHGRAARGPLRRLGAGPGTRMPGWARGIAFAVLFYVVLFGAVPVGERFVYYQF